MALEQTVLTALHCFILVSFLGGVIFAASRVFQRRNTYNAWLLPFAYFSLGSWVFWVLYYLILITEPLISFRSGILQNTSMWLAVMQNALWACAILSLHSKHFSRVPLILPLLVMFSIGIALVIGYHAAVLTSVSFIMIAGVSAAAMFTALAISILQLPVSKILAVTFFIHGYFQWYWYNLGFTSLSQNRSVLFAFALSHVALLGAWISLISEMLVRFRVMISSTIDDLVEERAAVDRALGRLNLEGFRSETFGSLPGTPEAICEQRAKQCHIFILITGERYGHLIESRDKSVVEFEYEVARRHDPLKILVYIKDGVTRDPRLEEFVERLKNFQRGHFTFTFTRPAELFERIQLDVLDWVNSRQARITTRRWTLTR